MHRSRRSSRLILPDREKYTAKAANVAARAKDWSEVRPCGVRHEAEEQPGTGALRSSTCFPRSGWNGRLEDLMRELGYSRPTLYRYLKILKERASDVDPQLRLHAGAEGRRDGLSDASLRPLVCCRGVPYLKKLTADYSCTAPWSLRWYGNKILCVASESSAKNPIKFLSARRPMPLGRGAIARSILALLPRPRLLPLIERNLRRPARGWLRRHRR
jgi:DNA-binding IclR family transcriptional regulator